MINLINNVIDYIENNLDSTLNIDKIAEVSCTSRYHFQRLFHAVTGFTLTEYIRNRRLTLAAEELIATNVRVIDVALKYGYATPDAFTKAFQRLHGITPSALKKGSEKLKAFPKLSLQLSIKGENEMTYRIVKKEGFKVKGVGFVTTTVEDACYKEIPKFCNKIWEDGTHHRINQLLGYSKMNLLHGIHYAFQEDGSRRYMLGAEYSNSDNLHELETLYIPECTWVVFEDKGTMPHGLAIQVVWKRIYSEWFPSSGFEQVEGPCIEKHYWNDSQCLNYTCEIWIPVKRK